MAHRIKTENQGARQVVTLLDEATGSSASILPAHGFNLFDLRLPVAGKVTPVVAAAPDFVENPRPGAGNGVPVLFPYPNRVKDGKFTFQGKSYQLPVNSGAHAIHGFAVNAPWEVIESKAGADSASVTGRFEIARHAPKMLEHWPTDGILTIQYTLAGRRLTMNVSVTNPTAVDFPYGFGVHPYFRCPFTPGGDQAKTKVILPASEYWPLEGYIPVGKTAPVTDRLDFRKGQAMKGLKLDDVLTGLRHDDGRSVCRLVDESLNAEFRLSFDRNIRELVVYTPPGDGGVISLEPYTQTTDAINLASRGVDGGLRVLGHSKTDTFAIVMETVG